MVMTRLFFSCLRLTSWKRRSGVLLERGAYEVLVRIEYKRLLAVGYIGEALWLDGSLDRVVVHPQLGSDGAHLPVLPVEEPKDARAKLRRDHRATSKSTC